MVKKYLFIAVLLISFISTAQDINKIYLEADFNTKISIGETSREIVMYDNISVDVPKVSHFNNAVYGITLSMNYQLLKNFAAGVGSGVNFALYDNHPVLANEYQHRIFIPFFLRLRGQKLLGSKSFILSDLNAGYNYANSSFGNSQNGYHFKERGGYLLNLNLGIGTKIYRFTPIFKVGYELNQFSHENSLEWIGSGMSYDDKVKFKTYYHLLTFSLSMKL